MKIISVMATGAISACCFFTSAAQSFTLEDALAFPYPSQLTAAKSGARLALAVNEKGLRNIYTAEAPEFTLKKVTPYTVDDGQEITGMRITDKGDRIVFVRGGDHGAYEGSVPRDPFSSPVAPKVQVITVPFDGGKPVVLGEGDDPEISPDGKKVAWINNDQVWWAPADGSSPAKQMFFARGEIRSASWFPDGKRMVFTVFRKDHSFIGIYTDSVTPIQWIAPALARDQSPRLSPDGKQIAFIRRPASGGPPDSLTVLTQRPWSICIADIASGKSSEIWKAPSTLRGSFPETEGGTNLHWAAGGRIVFVSYQDGWPHLYSILPGSEPLLLTNGNYAIEHVSLSTDGKWIVASSNKGPDINDIDRRHVVKISVDRPGVQVMTPGTGIESFPVVSGDGRYLAMISADAKRPDALGVIPFSGGKISLPGATLIPKTYPSGQFVIPKAVHFSSTNGLNIHGQLFTPASGPTKKPAVIFVHGGPERQMLLGWHYGDYYSNTYALNQYLVSLGFVVLSVNYRLGIGYGFEFQNAPDTWTNGASEYDDIRAAGEWLAKQPGVDSNHIGIYGGSYGGYLTAFALGKDSKLFKAGVDIHGVHNLTRYYPDPKGEQAPDAALAKELIWKSSPVAWLDNWTSPVLLIHGDDDGNVQFSESVDLANRFRRKGFAFESLVIPDETHHWLRHSNTLRVDAATSEFLQRKLMTK